MSNSKIPSPARSYGGMTPRKYQPRSTRTRSVASPARSNASTRLTALMQDAFQFSPMPRRRSVLNDDTDVQEPIRKSWWKNLDENSRDMVELFQNIDAPATENVLEDIDMEAVSQEQNYSVDIPDSSDGESIRSIIVPQRKLFPRKENTKKKYFEDYNNIIQRKNNKSSKSIAESDKDITTAPRNLFNQGENRSIPIFPAGLLNKICANASVDTSVELQVEAKKSRNLFGNQAGTKRKNTFIDFIVSDNEDEINDNQPKVFGFKRQSLLRPGGSSVINSPTSSILDIEEEWQLLPSSTMIGHQSDVEITPKRRKPSTSYNKSHMSEMHKQKKSLLNKENNINNTLVASNISNDVETENNRQNNEKDLEKTKLEHKNENISVNDISENRHLNNTKNKSLNVIKTSNTKNKSLNISKTKKILTKNKETSVAFENQAQEKDSSANNFNKTNVGFENPNLSKQKITPKKLGDKVLHEMVQDMEMCNEVPDTNNECRESSEDENIQLRYDENDGGIVPENLKKLDDCKNNKHVNSPSNKNNTSINVNIQTANMCSMKKNSEANAINVHEKDGNEIEKVINRSDENNAHQSSEDELHTVVEQRQNATDEFIMEAVLESVNESDDEQIEQVESDIEHESNLEKPESIIQHEESKIERRKSDTEKSGSEIEQEKCEDEQKESEIDQQESEIEHDESEDEQNESEIEGEQDESGDEQQESEIEPEQIESEQDESGNEQQESEIEQEQIEGEQDESEDNQQENEIDGQSEAEQEQEIDNEQIKQNSNAHGNVYDSQDDENKIINHIEHSKDIPHSQETKINETLKHPEAALNCNTNTISDSFLIDRRSLSIRKTKSVILHHEPLQDRTGLSDGTRDSSANNSGWDSHRTTRKTLRQTFGNDFTPRKSLRTLVMEKSAKRQTHNMADNIINGNKSREAVEIRQSSKDDEENVSSENVLEQSNNDNEAANSSNEKITQVNNDTEINDSNDDEEKYQSDDCDHEETNESNNDEAVNQTDNNYEEIVNTNDDDEIHQSGENNQSEIEESNNDEDVDETDDNDQGDMVQSNDDEEINQSDESDRNEMVESINDELNETGNNNDHEEMVQTNDDEEINHSDDSDDEEMGQNHLDDNEEISKMPQANSTEYPVFESMAEIMEEVESIKESHQNKSQKKKKTMREILEQIKAENMERKRKIDEEVDNWLKTCSKPSQSANSYFKVPQKPAIRRPTNVNKPKTKPTKNLPFSLPEEFLEDLKYKPPKRYQPKNAAWATKRLYAFLETKLEPKYDYKARVRAEKLVETVYNFTRDIRRTDVAPPPAVAALKQEMARLAVVRTHFDFYEFVKTYMPRDVRNKVVPSITNKIALPKPSVFADILQ